MAEKLKNPKKADLNKDGKLSSYEKKRGAAIEKAMDKSEGMSRAQQAAIAIAKMKKEELAELVREVLAEKTIDEENAFVKTKKGEEALVDVDPTDSSVKNDPNIVSIKTTSGKKIKELTSVGHVDDEPGMLKQFAYDTADYAAKLYKLLHHYEQMEDHVDFPNWWQHKVMMAREYMSKATHYLEFETMKPQIDAAVDRHSEEGLAEDYVPRTKEDLVFQYLRDAWQFGATNGKDVNPDRELSTMADSLLANLPDYDAADRVNEQAESLQAVKQKIEEKLKALGLQTKVFEGEFEVPKNARDMIAKNNKLGALAYSRDKSIFAGHPEYERLEVIVHKDHLEDLKKIASEFKMPSGSVQAFAGTDFVRLRHTADVVSESVELDEIKKAEFEKIKPGKELQLRGYGVVKVIENDGIVMKIKDSLDKVHTINLGQYNEKFLKEDDDVEPSKKDIKAAEKDVKNVSDDKKQQFNRALAFIKKFKDNPGAVAGMLKKAKEEYKLPKNLLKDLARAAQVSETLAEGVSCCGRCGRVHESAQDCKKPYISKDSPRHCKNKK